MKRCGLYAHYCAVIESHHICPKSWWVKAGKPVNTPMAEVCPNCHMDAHYAIDSILAGHDLAGLPPRCVALARQAYAIAEANGLTPARTL